MERLYPSFKSLSINNFENYISKGALILDTRPAHLFDLGFIKDSINIGINGDFDLWVSSIVDINQQLLIVTEAGKEKDVILKLTRCGYHNVPGFLENGIDDWKSKGKYLDTIENIDAFDFCYLFDTREYLIIDVRKSSEVAKEKVLSAIHIPLDELKNKIEQLDKYKNYIVYCVGGYRSMIAASIMKKHKIKNVMNLSGGILHLKEAAPALIH